MGLVMQFMIDDTRIVHKLRLYIRVQFDSYRENRMGTHQNIHEHPPTKPLNRSKKRAICDYIDRLEKINICGRPLIIVGAVNYLIRFEDRVVGHHWLKRFLKRNLEYHVCKQKPLAADRKQSHSVHNISDYFDKVELVMSENWITDLDM